MATTGKDAAEPEREQPNRSRARTPDDVNTPKPPPPQPQQHQQQREQPSPSPPQPSPPPPPPPPPVDGESYYGYLFNKDKTATDLLDAMLRAIANYIACNIGDRKSTGLDPKKLAAFYHAVGGDYDTLFLNAPAKSISYIWQALGVQHVLQQPAGNCYVEPSVPALTVEGFVRWETIQILLEPGEHAPYIQFAVRNWALKHPGTGEPFPPDLPRKAFPATCDPEIDKWHRSCAERLKQEAALQEEHPPQPSQHPPQHPPQPSPQPPPARDPRVHAGFNHVHGSQVKNTSPRRRHEMDYFSRDRPARVVHIPVRRVPASHHTSPRRCRSYSDLRPPPDPNVRFSTRLHARAPPAPRRHSQPRPYSPSSDSESDSGSDALPRSTSTSRLYSHVSPTPPPSIRLRSHPPPPTAATSARPHRPEVLPNDPRRLSLPAEIKQKITSLLSRSHDRHRSSSREHASGRPSIRPRYTRETPPSRRGRHGLSDGSYSSDESDSEVSPKRRTPRDRERERARRRQVDREVERERERELAEEREMRSRSREERVYLRPTADPRPSSHADAERIPRDFAWERDRDRGGDWDRAGRRVTTSSEREQRDRRRRKSYGTSPIKGVTGRRYPAEPPWT
ncbi:hypothetical protein DL766_001655 [Monosporascus sp. MC13-8B]|uniref:DUF7514 domain-containing protein n=1 Tax=Monosporascus cannonballus TaxID=155416 RepID=A0ABY0GYD5_9PEZI|nr:hypothetical protein DL762_007694 [Monosporascus cannonballus]RYP37081.1 hypothetical protein DL766_001655 [Monosporascus sp. MC13-8B]